MELFVAGKLADGSAKQFSFKGWIFDSGCVICGTAVVRDMQLSIGQYAARIGKKVIVF